MQKLLLGAGIFGCLLVGIFVDSLLSEDWQQPSVMMIMLWPIALFGVILFGIAAVVYELGNKLKKKLFK